MKLSSRSRYAISAMVELATQTTEAETPIVRMAQSYNLSQSSMEQLFARLRSAGLVNGRRGRRGGYRLARPAEQIALSEIIAAVDEEYGVRASAKPGPVKASKRVASPVWDCISKKLYAYLDGLTLADAIANAGNEVDSEKSEWSAAASSGDGARKRQRVSAAGLSETEVAAA